MTTKILTRIAPLAVVAGLVAPQADAASVAVAGVDFEGAANNIFDRNPDDLVAADGITVSSGNNGSIGLFDGWTILQLNGNPGGNGNLGNDNGARNAGATTPNFPARLEGSRTGSWSITVDSNTYFDLDRIVFDWRGATGGNGRDGFFTTSLEAPNVFLEQDTNLIGRNTATALGNGWQRITHDFAGTQYDALNNTTVDFIWETNNSSGTGAIDLDTILVYGTIVPSPTAALAGLIGLGGLMVRRRRG